MELHMTNIKILQGILEYLENEFNLSKDFVKAALGLSIFGNQNEIPVIPDLKSTEEIIEVYDLAKAFLSETSKFEEFHKEFYTVYEFYKFVISHANKSQDAQTVFLHCLKVAASLKWE